MWYKKVEESTMVYNIIRPDELKGKRVSVPGYVEDPKGTYCCKICIIEYVKYKKWRTHVDNAEVSGRICCNLLVY